MKKIFTLILFIAWALNANGQVVRDSTYLADSIAQAIRSNQLRVCHSCLIGIEGTDALGNRDTLFFGADTNATVAVDNQFGEIEVSNRPLKPMDMRFFQRSEICVDVLSIGDTTPRLNTVYLRYRQNIELKRDFRSSWKSGYLEDAFTASARKYAFKVATLNYPISFRLIQKTGSNQYRDLAVVQMIDFTNCTGFSLKELNNVALTDTIQFRRASDYYAIGTNIFAINSAKKKVKLELAAYPIPATEKIQITGLRSATSISVTSITGKEIKNVIVNPESPEVNIEGLEKGIYILHCQSKEGVQALRIVKQ